LPPALALCHVLLKLVRYKLDTNSLDAALSVSLCLLLAFTLLYKNTHEIIAQTTAIRNNISEVSTQLAIFLNLPFEQSLLFLFPLNEIPSFR